MAVRELISPIRRRARGARRRRSPDAVRARRRRRRATEDGERGGLPDLGRRAQRREANEEVAAVAGQVDGGGQVGRRVVGFLILQRMLFFVRGGLVDVFDGRDRHGLCGFERLVEAISGLGGRLLLWLLARLPLGCRGRGRGILCCCRRRR